MRALLLPLLLAGCAAGKIDAPSLSPRPAEKTEVPMPDEASEPQVAADPALIARIAEIEKAAQDAHAAFETARGPAEATITKAANVPAGSEAWIAAQQELSTLDSTRGGVGHAAADLDGLRNEPANATSGNRAAIEAAGQRIEALSKAEADVFARLSGMLKS